ncbi:MAG: class I SAM-dependent methyltransferase [Myxococcota bacterium]
MPYPARFYAAIHRGTPGDLEHYQRMCQNASSVLELGCGYGRVVAALAAPARQVVGVDNDPDRLAMAAKTVATLAPDHRAGVELVEGDMRTVDLGHRFDRILLPFGGLYCLLDDADLHATLTTVARHLAPGGRVGLDVYRADEFHHDSEPDDLPEDAHTTLGRIEVDGIAYEVLERSTWDKTRQRIDASYLHVDETGHAIEGTIAQRYLLEDQLRAALARAGLTITRLSGAFDTSPPGQLTPNRRGDDTAADAAPVHSSPSQAAPEDHAPDDADPTTQSELMVVEAAATKTAIDQGGG